MKMKRSFLSVVALLLLLCTLFVGCGPQTPQVTTTAKQTTSPGTTVEKTTEGATTLPSTTPVTTTPLPTEPTTTEAPTTELPTTEPPTTELPTTETPTTEPPTTELPTTEEVTTTPPPIIDTTPVVDTANYLPALVSSRIKTYFEGKKATASAFSTQYAPYAIPDVYTLSNCAVLSITIPVMQTKKMNADGDFIFTIYVFDNSFAGMKSPAKRSYPIRISGEDFALPENGTDLYRLVKVDLSSYDIHLSDSETMAFFAPTDTLVPAYTGTNRSNQLSMLMMQGFEQSTAFYRSVGSADMVINQGFFFFDFELERTYENQAELDAVLDEEFLLEDMIDALAERYEGKYLSILGDSISTFTGVSNNSTYNKTIGDNRVYYGADNHTMYDSTDTYWGRLLRHLDMELCVPNAWSGSYVYGRPDTDRVDNMVRRATELDNDNGTPDDPTDDIAPDLIIVYIGINDLNNNSPFGDLYELIANTPEDRIAEKTGSWFERTVKPQADAVDGIVAGETYKTWEQAYALGINAMREKYPDAEILLFTLAENNHGSPKAKIAQYNACIKAIASYFGATVIDQSAIVTQETCHAYASDKTALHPSSYGHLRMERLILDVLYEKLEEN